MFPRVPFHEPRRRCSLASLFTSPGVYAWGWGPICKFPFFPSAPFRGGGFREHITPSAKAPSCRVVGCNTFRRRRPKRSWPHCGAEWCVARHSARHRGNRERPSDWAFNPRFVLAVAHANRNETQIETARPLLILDRRRQRRAQPPDVVFLMPSRLHQPPTANLNQNGGY